MPKRKDSPLNLNEVGQAYIKSVTAQMKDLGTFMDGDSDVFLGDIGLQYQLYREELETSLDLNDLDGKESSRHHLNSMRHLKTVQDMQKQLGLGPLQRKKLQVQADTTPEQDSMIDKIGQILGTE